MTGDIDTATHSLPPLAAAAAAGGDTVPATGQPLPSHTMTTLLLPHRHCDPLYCQSVVERDRASHWRVFQIHWIL